MKIAVFHNLPSGGAKRALHNYVKYLKCVGHQIDVHVPATADENYLPLKDLVDGYYVYPLRRTVRGALSPYVRYFLPRSFPDLEQTHQCIAEKINEGTYDVVFSEQDRFTFTPFLLRHLKKPTVYYCQQPCRQDDVILQELAQAAFPSPPLPLPKRMWCAYLTKLDKTVPQIDRANARHARYILANSYFSREAILRAYGLNAYVSYLGVDTDIFRPLNLARENFVLSVGACWLHKGHDFTIRSLGLIDERIRPRLVIVSNGTDASWEAHLVRLAARLRVHLDLKTSVSDNDIVCLYNQTRLFVYGAILEPFGLAPVEAMACGTPVVAVKEGGARESVLDAETGILTPRDEAVFADAVSGLLENDERRKRMGCRAVEVVRSFWTIRHAGERLEAHLKRAVARNNQDRPISTNYQETRQNSCEP